MRSFHFIWVALIQTQVSLKEEDRAEKEAAVRCDVLISLFLDSQSLGREAVSDSWKTQGSQFFPECPMGRQPNFIHQQPCSTSRLQNGKMAAARGLKPLGLCYSCLEKHWVSWLAFGRKEEATLGSCQHQARDPLPREHNCQVVPILWFPWTPLWILACAYD